MSRFGHPLIDHVNVKSFLSLQTIHAKDLNEDESGSLSADDLEVLALSESASARIIAAGHPRATANILERLAKDPQLEVRKAVGHNPVTPAEVILSMQRHDRSGQASHEIDAQRLRFLWTELKFLPVDRDLALEIARDPNFHYDEHDRRALARKQLPIEVRKALAQNRSTPVDVLLELANDAEPLVRIAAGSNPSLPEDARLHLLQDNDRQVRREVTIHGQFRDAVVVGFDEESESRYNLQARLIAGVWVWGDTRCLDSEQVLRDLARSVHPSTRAAVAMNPFTPLEILERLADDPEKSVRDSVAKVLSFDSAWEYYSGDTYLLTYIWWYRRELDEADLSVLAQSRNAALRAVAARRMGRGDELHALAHDSDPGVRGSAAGNHAIDFDDLIRSADDADEQVRERAASAIANQLRLRQQPPRTRENWLERQDHLPAQIPQKYSLSGSGPDSSRLNLGEPWLRQSWWPKDDALGRLARVTNTAVRRAVASYSGCYISDEDSSAFVRSLDYDLGADVLLSLLADSDEEVRESALTNVGPTAVQIAASRETPQEALVGYSRSKSVAVRLAVATNPATPGPVLANLARDQEGAVRTAVAKNRNTPGAAVRILTSDPCEEVVLELLSNSNAPPEFLEQQIDRPSDRREHERLRRIASNATSPADVLRKAAFSEWADVRALVARHPETPSDTLEILSFDEHAGIREEARRRAEG